MRYRKPWPKWAYACTLRRRQRLTPGRYIRAPNLRLWLMGKRLKQFDGRFITSSRKRAWRNGLHRRLYRRAVGITP